MASSDSDQSPAITVSYILSQNPEVVRPPRVVDEDSYVVEGDTESNLIESVTSGVVLEDEPFTIGVRQHADIAITMCCRCRSHSAHSTMDDV